MLLEVKPEKRIFGEAIDFTMQECGNCGIPYYVPTKWRYNKVQEHGSFYCPNGCNRVFVAKSEAEKVKEELEKLKLEKQQDELRLTNLLLDEINKSKDIKRQLRRVSNGVCPCCNRSFKDLKAHMKTKHPEIKDK